MYGRHVRTWVNSLGAEWRNELLFGGETLLSTSFFQAIDQAHRFFVEPRVAFSRTLENIFLDDERVARYQFRDFIGQIDLGANFGRYAQARVGYMYDERNIEVDVGSPLLAESNPTDAGIVLQCRIRQPRHGVCADARIRRRARIPQLR